MIDLKKEYPIPVNNTWNIIDSSKMDDLIDCYRKFFFRHLLGWESTVPNNHLKFGEAWHLSMEHLRLNGFGEGSIQKAFDKFLECYREEFLEDTDALYDPKTPARAMKALVAYTKEWPMDLVDHKVLYTEISGSVPVVEDWPIYFRMDDIHRDKRGLIGSLEHKTKGGSFSSSYVNQWLMSPQLGTYHHVLYSLYDKNEIAGVKINGAGFLKTKFDFQRFPLFMNQNRMQVWHDMISYYLSVYETEMGVLTGENPANHTMMAFPPRSKGCSSYFGCPYIDFCTCWSNPLVECHTVPMGFRIKFWNPIERKSTIKFDDIKKGGES